MKNRICFIGNFYKTPVYEAIACELSKYECETYWLIPNPTQYKDCVSKYGTDHVLLIDQTIISSDSKPIADLKVNEIVYGDRIWKYQFETGIRYLISLQEPVFNFLHDNAIHTVFGENTTSEELLISRMCHIIKDLNCRYFSLMTTRIPNDRFFFFEDEKQSIIWKGKKEEDSSEISLQVKKPAYFSSNNSIIKKKMALSGMAKRVKYFITNEHIDNTDPDVLTKRKIRFRVKTREVINQQVYRFVKRKEITEYSDKKYVFFGFHKQPESSIDVCGRYKEDQHQTILNIWRQLPPDWLLLIKEHSNAIGDRSYSYFKELERYPGIIILNELTDSYTIMDSAQLVITNTGTMGLEAALKGIPAITLSRVTFNCLNYCRYMTWDDFEKYNSLEDLVDEMKNLPMNNQDYETLVRKFAFKGKMGDTFSSPKILEDKENIHDLAEAFWTAARSSESNTAK